MKTSTTDIWIPASPQVVWAVLTDFASYRSWNPFIRQVDGVLEAGARWRLQLATGLAAGGTSFTTVRAVVTQCVAGRRLSWRGGAPIPGLLTGVHDFVLAPASGGTALVQSESYAGLLAAVLFPALRARTQVQFSRMNEALKAEVVRRGLPDVVR